MDEHFKGFGDSIRQKVLPPVAAAVREYSRLNQLRKERNQKSLWGRFIVTPMDTAAETVLGAAGKGLEVLGKPVEVVENVVREGIQQTSKSFTGKRIDATALAVPSVALTITNPKRLARGIYPGVARSAEFAPSVNRWVRRTKELDLAQRYPAGQTVDRRLKNQKKTVTTKYNAGSTLATRIPDNPEVFDKTKYKVKGFEQHHLFPKQESWGFVERMNELGDHDDVLNLVLYAEDLDAGMGGYMSNILNMNKKTHNVLHADRRLAGLEPKRLELKKRLKAAKTTDELMDMFDDYIRTNILPSKHKAFEMHNKWLDSQMNARRNLNQFKSLSQAERRRL